MQEYVKQSVQGFELQFLQSFQDDALLLACCMGKDNTEIPFEDVHSSPATEVFRFSYQGKNFYYKKFLKRNKRDSALKIWLRGWRSGRSLAAHQTLTQSGFNNPDVVIEGYNPKTQDNFIVTEAVEDAIQIHQLAIDNFDYQQHGFTTDKARFLKTFGQQIGQLHANNISHGDLLIGNVFFKITPRDEYQFIFIDNERTTKHWRIPSWKRVKNLVQLNLSSFYASISFEDKLVFLKAYFSENPALRQSKWINKVALKTGKRRAKTANRLFKEQAV